MIRALPLLVFLGAVRTAAQMPESSGAPAKNWEMKLFTKEGPLSMILRGSEVTQRNANRYDFVNLNITTFSGKADRKVESVLLSPSASFFPKDNRAEGDESVRLIRDDMEITGTQWTYERTVNRVSIHKNNRVVFHAELPDLLR
jgi:hypothetical protein